MYEVIIVAVVIIIAIIIVVAVAASHNNTSPTRSLTADSTIKINNDDIRKIMDDRDIAPSSSLLINRSLSENSTGNSVTDIDSQEPQICQKEIPLEIKSLVESSSILPYGANFVSLESKLTDISRSACDSNKGPGLFNMSVRKVPDGYSGVIRGSTWNGCCTHNTLPAFSYAYYINLDDNGAVKDLGKIPLDYDIFTNCTQFLGDIYAGGIEDPRLFIFKGEEWVICNSLGLHQQPHPCVNAMSIFKVSDPMTTFRILTSPLKIDPQQRQKNWSPFEYNGELYCEYSLDPHIILKVDIDLGLTEEKWRTGSEADNIVADTSLRGGAPPILINNYIGNSNVFSNLPATFYMGVGHTRTDAHEYLHFFYAFEAIPPFKMIGRSTPFKLDGNERVQFVAGLSCLDNMIYVSYGVDDCYNRISKFHSGDIFPMITN